MDIIEERVLINGQNKIGATISRFDDKVRPLILIIMGTGKLDRDGNIKGFKTNLYKNMSDMFVNMGYVCIRYDKRGTHQSTGKFKSTGLFDLVNDAAQVIEYAKELTYVDSDRIIVCGHSEGSMVATLLTKQTKLEKIILLGGACMCLKSAMEYQNFRMLDEFKDKKGFLAWFVNKTVSKEKVIKQLESLYDKAKNAKKDTFFFRGAFLPSKWLREHGELNDDDFVKMIEEYDGKVLAITGRADLQADYTCLDKITGLKNVITYAPEKVNHMLKEIDDDNSFITVKKQYKRLVKNAMHDGVVKQIDEFLKLK